IGTNNQNRILVDACGKPCYACQDCAPVAKFSGCVGIGSTSPQHKLDIKNGNLAIYNNTNVGGGSGGAQLYLGDMNFAGGVYACSRVPLCRLVRVELFAHGHVLTEFSRELCGRVTSLT
ncbi:MAG: hypothetical protein AN484_28745, partial [Aphanizomenon flos-aquae WA102]